MTPRQKIEAEEQRQTLFSAADWRCLWCNRALNHHGTPQLAHRVPKKASMIMKWGSEVIHHPLNLVPVDCLHCNDHVSLGSISLEGKALLERIVRINTGVEEMPDMVRYYAELRILFQEKHHDQ